MASQLHDRPRSGCEQRDDACDGGADRAFLTFITDAHAQLKEVLSKGEHHHINGELYDQRKQKWHT